MHLKRLIAIKVFHQCRLASCNCSNKLSQRHMANLHTENGVRSTAQDPGLFSQQIHSDLVSIISLHEGQNVTKVVVSPSCTFIVLSAAKQKNRETAMRTKVCLNILFADQRWSETLIQTPTPLLFQNFWIQVRIRLFFKFKNPTPVETPATIIDPTLIYPCFNLRNNHIESCYCWNGKVTPDPGPVFHKFLTLGPDPYPKEKRRLLPESTPVILIGSHLYRRQKTAT